MSRLRRDKLLLILKKGVSRSIDLMARITDYHGGPLTTEYLLTSDIAREFIESGFETSVEYKIRNLANGYTLRTAYPRKRFGSKRTDVAVLYQHVIPLAIVEVKIGIKTITGLQRDLLKIIETIDALKPAFASRVIGVSVFQVHIAGNERVYQRRDLKRAMRITLGKIDQGLLKFAKNRADYELSLHPLQVADAGYTAREKEIENGATVWGRHGHATRYYAIVVRSKVAAPGTSKTIQQLKARSKL